MATTTKKKAAPLERINPSLIPPSPSLRLALVGVVDLRIFEMAERLGGMTGDKLRRYAKFALTFSQKDCFFCGKASSAAVKKAVKAKTVAWEALKDDLCECLADIRTGYREYYPWQTDVDQMGPKIVSGDLRHDQVMYTDSCSRAGCGTHIEVTAIMIARNFVKYGMHRQMKKCKSCRDEAAKRSLKQVDVAAPAAPTHAAFPRKRRNREPLQATVAEIAEAHSPLEENLMTIVRRINN